MTTPRCLTLAQFAKERGGLVTTADVDSHIHAGLRSKPQPKSYDRWNAQTLKSLQNARDATVAAYLAAIASGDIRDMTPREKLEATANGHPDNKATQAAKRILMKRRLISV